MKKEEKVFRSRISVLFFGFILAAFIGSIISVNDPDRLVVTDQVICKLGGVFLLVFVTICGICYVISDNKLCLKIMWFIPFGCMNIADIVSVKRTYNPLASPAGSLKRLRVRFTNNSFGWLISPSREQEFIEALKAINPDISVNIPERKGKWRIWDWDI
jgi:hypothetical protein